MNVSSISGFFSGTGIQRTKWRETKDKAAIAADVIVDQATSSTDSIAHVSRTFKDQIIMSSAVMGNDEVNPQKTNPRNCTYAELKILLNQLSEHPHYHGTDFSLPDDMDDIKSEAKMDFLSMIDDWLEIQGSVGNMVGYRQVLNISTALYDAEAEAIGEVQYMNGDRVFYASTVDVIPSFPYFSFFENGVEENYRMGFSDNSTSNNPIIDVQHVDSEGHIISSFQIKVNDVNPKDASLMEMYALCNYRDYQSANIGRAFQDLEWKDSTFFNGYQEGVFRIESRDAFTKEKQNWIALIERHDETNNGIRNKITNRLTEIYQQYLLISNKKEELIEALFKEEWEIQT